MRDFPALLINPLIIGASISAGFLSEGPGTLLAKKYTAPQNIKILAGSGHRGVDFFSRYDLSVLDDRTAVIAVDLFFWDSILANVEESFQAMKNLLAATRHTRLIIGDVPELFPQFQVNAKAINRDLHQLFARRENVTLVPLHKLHQRLLRDKFIEIGKSRLTLRDFMPDGLHVGALGSQFLADYIESFLIQPDTVSLDVT